MDEIKDKTHKQCIVFCIQTIDNWSLDINLKNKGMVKGLAEYGGSSFGTKKFELNKSNCDC